MGIDRAALFDQLFTELNNSLATATQAANDARALATHEQSKPETQYDTVGLEASYLAHGQSQRVAEIKLAIEDWKGLRTKIFDNDSEISVGALIQLTDDHGTVSTYLLGNYSGGLKLTFDGDTVMVITNNSPLGKLLDNQCVGDEIKHPILADQYLEIHNIF